LLRRVDWRKARQQGTDQRTAQHIQRQKETGGTGIRARHWVYPVCRNGVRGVQNGEEGRFFTGTGGGGKTTGPRSKPRNRESAGRNNHGQELVGASGCAGGYLAAGKLVSAIATALDDAKDEVRFAAAACVAHLSEIRAEKTPAEPARP